MPVAAEEILRYVLEIYRERSGDYHEIKELLITKFGQDEFDLHKEAVKDLLEKLYLEEEALKLKAALYFEASTEEHETFRVQPVRSVIEALSQLFRDRDLAKKDFQLSPNNPTAWQAYLKADVHLGRITAPEAERLPTPGADVSFVLPEKVDTSRLSLDTALQKTAPHVVTDLCSKGVLPGSMKDHSEKEIEEVLVGQAKVFEKQHKERAILHEMQESYKILLKILNIMESIIMSSAMESLVKDVIQVNAEIDAEAARIKAEIEGNQGEDEEPPSVPGKKEKKNKISRLVGPWIHEFSSSLLGDHFSEKESFKAKMILKQLVFSRVILLVDSPTQ